MSKIEINTQNLFERVQEALELTNMRLDKIKYFPDDLTEKRDLRIAREALELIFNELSGRVNMRPKGSRSSGFTRYVLDEESNLKIDPNLRDLIVRIESVYQKY